mmetsp:Transcript_78865/g.229049  ORF Transcript_78865/g.229049 Transcript_78865/m.229049 type:complete len:318 (-) Transcript_78865:176-1129(-)
MVERASGHHICARGVGAAEQWPSLWEHLTNQRPPAYSFLIPMAAAGATLTAMVTVPTLARLCSARAKGASRERLLFAAIPVAAPLVVAVLKLLIALSPRFWKLLNIPSVMFEALAFWSFLQLLLSFMAGTKGSVAAALAGVQPVRICCCVYRKPRVSDILRVKLAVWFFMVVLVALSIIELAEDWVEQHYMLLAVLYTFSLIVCVVAEIALIRMGKELLEGHRPHMKFWTMKGLYVANTMFARVFNRTITEDLVVGHLCYSRETLVAAWSGGCTAIFAFIVAVLASFAFVPADLEAEPGEEESSSPAGTRESSTASV